MHKRGLPKRIVIEVIPPEDQRYRTVGDWTTDGPTLTIRVSDTHDTISPHVSFCVAVHELLEAYLCLHHGISAADVDASDRLPLRKGYEEHGDMPDICYHDEHDFAWCVERLVAHELGVDWKVYDDVLGAAYDRAPKKKP